MLQNTAEALTIHGAQTTKVSILLDGIALTARSFSTNIRSVLMSQNEGVMARSVMVVVAASLFATVGLGGVASGATSLLVPQSTAFSVLGHSCGGIQEQALATGFDATSGFPTGDVYLLTRCGGSGRGGGYKTITYSAWVGATWDYTGVMVSYVVLAVPPTNLDPTFSAFDSFGNEVYNVLNAVNVPPANCTVGNTTYCTYRAYLSLAPTFVPPPRVTSIAVTLGPATGGTSVTITGTGFTGATAVTFGDTPAPSFVVNSDTSITAVSPAEGVGTVDVTVTTDGGTSAATASDEFTFVAAPVVSSISPNSGPVSGGTEVTITGANFVDVTSISFGGDPAGFEVNDDSSITAWSPAIEGPDVVHVRVTNIGGMSATSAADRFTYVAPACGNGTLDPGELCDDGNTSSGDGCSAQCQVESCFTCAGQPSACSPDPAGTACDDGNACTVGETCNGSGMCGGFTSCRVNSSCNNCGQMCTQPQPGVCKCG